MPLPTFQPLTVTRRPKAFDHPDWLFELKHDGFRCIAYVEHGRCRLLSRKNNEFKSFSSLNAAIADELKGHSVVLDGEIVCLDDRGKPQFYDLLFHRGEPRLCAFDLLWCDGQNLQHEALTERKRKLRALIPSSGFLFYCDHVEECGESLFRMACETAGYVAANNRLLRSEQATRSHHRSDAFTIARYSIHRFRLRN